MKHTAFISGTFGARSARWCAALGLAAVTVGAAGCGSDTIRQGQGSSYLIVSLVEGANGAKGDNVTFSSQPVPSDVITFVKRSNSYSIFLDPGRVKMRLAMKDVTNPTGPSDNNAITINRYRVEYSRSDGRNTPGVDVPHPYDSAVTFTVSGGDEVTIPFELVRINAKEEAPLRNLVASGGAVVISTVAHVTFYGRDQVGHEVSVTASIGVNFADWGDPEN